MGLFVSDGQSSKKEVRWESKSKLFTVVSKT